MKLLDTMLIVYARTPASPFHAWAVQQIATAVSTEGAALNTVSLAELCSEDGVDSGAVGGAVFALAALRAKTHSRFLAKARPDAVLR